MKKESVLQLILFIFLCNSCFVKSNSSSTEQNIPTSGKTSSNMSNELDAVDNSYNGNNILEPSTDINDDMVKNENYIGTSIENSEKSKNILNNDTPVILTLSESSTMELENVVDSPLVSTSLNDKHKENNISVQVRTSLAVNKNVSDFNVTETQNKTFILENQEFHQDKNNISEDKNEEIPSFSEWAQKRLEEVEKNEQINSSSKGQAVNGKGTIAKLRWKNYASLDCGAKVIAANPESVSPGAILSPSSDEYKLNTCTSRIWFIVELCEAIQTKRIDLANYELFSSSPKDFLVSVSDRYPTRDWSVIGKFTAKDERDIQSFDLDTHIFGKYIKVEIKSHYGSEHYCPISLFRAYGTSVFEVLQKEDPGNINPTDDDDDDDDDHIMNLSDEYDDSQKNLFSSATDAVMSIVKKAAEVLGNKVNNRTAQAKNGNLNNSLINSCCTPNYMISCNNCSSIFFNQVYHIISCNSHYIQKLAKIPLIYRMLSNSWLCKSFGYEVELNISKNKNVLMNYITSFFTFKYLNAMCQEISILENKAVLNISQQFSNRTESMVTEEIVNLKVPEPYLYDAEKTKTKAGSLNRTQPLHSHNMSSVIQNNSSNTKENFMYVSQIKPTKTLNSEVQSGQTVVANNNNTLEQSFEQDMSAELIETESLENFVENTIDSIPEMEGMDSLDDHLEHFISDFNNENNQNIPISTTTTATNTPQGQKESVFLRLSNRIKVLERNMSLSSQYLEELSRRYKKQVEEMQHLLEKTIVTLHEETKKKDLRNKELEYRLDNLTAAMESLVAERRNWILIMYCLMSSSAILFGIYFFCRKPTTYADSARENKETPEILRRKSIDVITHSFPVKKKRRPSDQALKIVRCSAQSSEEDRYRTNNIRQKKRKKRNLVSSNSISHIKDDCYLNRRVKSDDSNVVDWIEGSHHVIEDIPFSLEESDHTTLEAYPIVNELTNLNSSNDIPVSPNSDLSRSCTKNNGSQNISQEEGSSINSEQSYLNNKISTTTLERVKKEKRSFKKLFKKVF